MTALPSAAILTLATQCAPNVAPQTVAAVVRTESHGNPLAVNVNDGPRTAAADSVAEVVAIAQRFVAAGYSVDLGLGQINSRNMRKLGLSWATVFDPCTNVAALGRVLTGNYEAALSGRDPQTALRVALSLYNTGSPVRGFRNGYVGRVVYNAGASDGPQVSSSFATTKVDDERSPIVAENSAPNAVVQPREAAPPAWNIFARAAYARSASLPSTTIRSRSVWSD